ncbi:MAG: rane protein-like protein, partial [Acidobacteria bacterium]|nr:rane protein-like protein [Acidobacteriota bacterium]
PALFYAIGRLWMTLRGTSDVALREPAAFFGVVLAGLPFFAPLPRVTRFVWSILLAFSSPFLFYSGRLKQYTLEAAACTLLLILFLRAMRDDRRPQWIVFFAVAAVCALTLHTPVPVIAALGAAALFTPGRRRLSIGLGFVGVGALAAMAYVLYTAPGPESLRLHGNMEEWFTVTGRWITSPASFLANTTHWLGHAFNLTRGWWLVLIPLVIAWILIKRDRILLAIAVIPPLLAVLGSIAHLYPYGEVRLMLFCFPGLYLAVADALSLAVARWRPALLILVPFVFRGVAGDPYNATYMHVADLHRMFATIAHSRPAGPIHADSSYAAPIWYYYPALRPRLVVGKVAAPSGPGWYVQRPAAFRADSASFTMREDEVIAVYVP